jgi:predicted nucleic acid-binding Zn ribbon protein
MKCVNHPEIDATGTCVKCGKSLCSECIKELPGKTYCQVCAQEIENLTADIRMSYCANCGKQIEEGKIFCSRCSHPVKVLNKHSLMWGSIFLAVLITLILIPVGIMIFALCGPNMSYTAFVFSLLGITIICYMIGGFTAGALAGYRGALHGMAAALMTCFVVMILTFFLVGIGNFNEGWNTGWNIGWTVFILAIELLFIPGFSALGGFWGERLCKR